MANQHTDSIAREPAQAEIETLLPKVVAHAPGEAVEMLAPYPNEFVAKMLTLLNPALAQDVLECFPSERRQKIVAAAPPEMRQQRVRNKAFPESTIGRMMEPALAVFHPQTTVAEATQELRHLVKTRIHYLPVCCRPKRASR